MTNFLCPIVVKLSSAFLVCVLSFKYPNTNYFIKNMKPSSKFMNCHIYIGVYLNNVYNFISLIIACCCY